MKQKKASRWKTVIQIAALAVICIGGMELLVCSIVDPPLYNTIMTPVRNRIHTVTTHVQSTVEQMAAKFTAEPEPELIEAPPEEAQPVDQFATDPAIWTKISELDNSATALEARGNAEILTGGVREITYYNQSDEQWAALPYGRDSIGGYGCGPTALAMAISCLTDQDITPAEMAQWASDNGYCAPGRGSYNSIVFAAAEAFGLSAESCDNFEPDYLIRQISSGKIAVALMGPGHFTKSGHFILLRGTTLSGTILVADPNSRDLSLTQWEPQLILDELATRRADGAPLWFLSNYNISGSSS